MNEYKLQFTMTTENTKEKKVFLFSKEVKTKERKKTSK